MIGKLIRFLITLLLAITMIPAGRAEVTAEDITESPLEGTSSAQAPEGYQPISSMDADRIGSGTASVMKADGVDNVKVLLIEDALPWSSNANTVILDGLGVKYEKTTTANFVSNVKLENFDVVIFANDQAFTAYENYAQFKEYLEIYANLGGVIVFGACDAGWAQGNIASNLPGDVTKGNHYASNNRVVSPGHLIVNGSLTDGNPITDQSLSGLNYCSHTYFDDDSLPPGTAIIIEDADYNAPTLIEYPLGNGRVIASGLTWEYHIDHGSGNFAQIAMDDLFLYAIRVSNGTIKDMSKLTEYRLSKMSHHIIVADSETTNPIEGAKVRIEVNKMTINETTDKFGDVQVTDYGKSTVTVSADGYKTRKFIYTTYDKSTRFFFLSKEENPKLPYVTMLEETDKEYDYLAHKYYYREGIDTSVKIKADAEWYGKTASKYKLYQNDANGRELASVESTNGEFNFKPGEKFKPGVDVKIRVFASDGTASKAVVTGIVIQKQTSQNAGAGGVSAGNIEDITAFQLFETTQSTLSDSTLTKLLPSTWKVSADLMPVKVSKEYDDEDGSYTFKGTIGFVEREDENILDKKNNAEWENLISQFKEAKKTLKNRKKMLNDFKKKLKAKKLTSQVSSDMQLLGYFELQYNAFGDLIKSSGGVIGKAEGKFTRGGTTTLPVIPIPVYYEFEFGAAVDIEGGIKITFIDKKASLGVEGKVEFTIPEITAGGGVGVYGVAQAGLAGNGALKIKVVPSFEGKLEAALLAKAKLLFVGEVEYQIVGNEWKLWPNGDGGAVTMNYGEPQVSDVVLTMAPNDYKDYTSDWNGSYSVLQDWVLPDTIPQLIQTGDQKIMFFQSNVGTDEDLIKVMYSVNNGGYWSEPLPVCDDDTYDLFYEAAEDNGTVHIVWEKASEPLTQDTAEGIVNELLQNSEIYYAQYDPATGTFTDAVNLTNNESVDMLPAIAAENGMISAYWANSESEDVITENTAYTIRRSVYDGSSWAEPEDVISVNGYLYDIAAGYYNGNSVLAYNDRGNLYTVENGSAHKISTEDAAADGLVYQNGGFLFAEDGVIYTYTPYGERSSMNEEGLAVASNFKYVETENRSAIVWAENDEENSVIHASIWTGQGFSKPVDIYKTDEYNISSYDVVSSSDGAWNIIADAVDRYDEARTVLLYQEIAPVYDLELNFAYADENRREDDLQPVTVTVTNTGETTINEVYVSVSGDDFYHEEAVSCEILPGAEEDLEIKLDVSEVSETKELTVFADAYGEDTYDNNYDSITIGLVDASVELEYFYNNGQIIVGAKVENQSNIPAHTTISVIEDNEDGVVLDMKNLGTIGTDEEVLFMYSFDPNEIDFGESDAKHYVFRVDTTEGDYNSENNLEYAIIYRNEETLSLSDSSLTIVYGNTATITPDRADELIWTSSDESVATVDENGKVKAVGLGTATISAKTLGGVRADCEVRVLFKDVASKSQYFYEPVYWAVDNGVTTGTSQSTFSPNDTCTRGHIVTFLYRAAGSPKVEGEMPFTDVKEGKFYYDAVLWAVQNNITTGTSATTFSPNDTCTRGHIVTFLYRYLNEPEAYGTVPFTDVQEGKFFYNAVLWAVQNNITTGTSATTFSPNDNCTRAQAVTFMYRAVAD